MRQAGSGHKHIRGQALRDGCDPRKYQKPRIGGGGLRHISNRPGLDGERASALGAEMGRGRNTVDIIQGVYVFQVRDRPSCEPRTLLQRDALCEGHVEAAVVPEAEADADAAAQAEDIELQRQCMMRQRGLFLVQRLKAVLQQSRLQT